VIQERIILSGNKKGKRKTASLMRAEILAGKEKKIGE
jgi:hypothetical protein